MGPKTIANVTAIVLGFLFYDKIYHNLPIILYLNVQYARIMLQMNW